jgi:hypothetical protein
MFRTVRTAVAALALFASTVAAQSVDHGKVGLGVALNPIAIADMNGDLAVLPMGLGNFTVPIWMGERVRLEPELGIIRASSESSNSGFTSQSHETILRYGATMHFMLARSGNFRPYVGPRVGFVRRSTHYESTGNPSQESKRTDNYIGVTIGSEYWFTPRFSLGAEVQLNRVGLGEEESTPQVPWSGSTSEPFRLTRSSAPVRVTLSAPASTQRSRREPASSGSRSEAPTHHPIRSSPIGAAFGRGGEARSRSLR